jgi:putative spermidine/putrescine transport system ATP-binding protein
MTRSDTPAASARSAYVLVSLGNSRWTLGSIRKIEQTASRSGRLLHWYLLDASEASSLALFQGLKPEEAVDAVRRQVLRFRSLLARASVDPARVHLASELASHEGFEKAFAIVREAFDSDARFAGAVRNQVFSNLQPMLRRVGILHNRDPQLDSLVEYLLRELAIKFSMIEAGRGFEYALKPEMPIWAALTRGTFAGLESFASLDLQHEAVSPDEEADPLQIESLSYTSRGNRAIGDASRPNVLHAIEFAARGVVAVVGPSGAGKTTLLRVIAGHLPARGSIRLNGRDVSSLPAERRNIVTVFQDFGLFPHLTGLQNVIEGARRHTGLARAERLWLAGQHLRDLGIEHVAERLPRMMSGGEQQRVAIARALMAEPELLLLDEPTAALDQLQRESLQNLVQSLRSRRPDLPIVLVSHDRDFAFSVADRLGVMDSGRLLAFGEPRELLSRPPSSRVARILGNHNVVPGRVGDDGVFAADYALPAIKADGAVEPGAWLALIPHDAITLCPATGEPVGDAAVTSLADLGAMVRISLSVGGKTLVAAAARRSLPPDVEAGSKVAFGILQDSVVLVRD